MKTPLIILGVCIAAGATWYLRNPDRAKLPPEAAEVASVRPQFERLRQRDRILVAGYLLRQRREIPSFPMRDDGPFTARTFGEAIAAQKAFLDANFQTPVTIITTGLKDHALKPLRDVVEVTGMEAMMAPARETGTRRQQEEAPGNLPPPPVEGPPVFTHVYFLRNLSDSAVTVSGAVDVRKAKPSRNDVGVMVRCEFWKRPIAARSSVRVECSNPHSQELSKGEKEVLESTEQDRLLVWTPEKITFADGRTLEFNEKTAVHAGKLWGFYGMDYAD